MDKEYFLEKLVAYGLTADTIAIEKFSVFTDMLLEYNQKFNLTAITDPKEIVIKHYIDSLMGEKYLRTGARVIDIGAGAGFPSLPLKFVREDLDITMLDSLNKRIGFLDAVISQLNLQNIRATHMRCEEMATKGKVLYDYVLARAVAPLPTLLEYAIPLLAVGGELIAYKGDKAEDEISASKRALYLLKAQVMSNNTYLLDKTYDRSIMVIKKMQPTPDIYPRGQNKPKIQPL